MRIALVCVGRLKAGPERELFQRYLSRLTESARSIGVAGVDLREIDQSRARRPEDRREAEAASIIVAAPANAMLIALDVRGEARTSEEWAREIGQARDAACPVYAVLIGGPDGLAASLRATARRIVSFGTMTWPHQLVRVMASEQLYRAVAILSGHPYHRG